MVNDSKYEKITINIEPRHKQYMELRCINISAWIRKKIDEDIEAYK